MLSLVGFVCMDCATLFHLRGEATSEEQDLVQALMQVHETCPVCGTEGSLHPTTRSTGYRAEVTLTATELWRACMGLGLPDQGADPQTVYDMLLGSRVVEAWIEPTSQEGRSYISGIVLENGKVLHIGVSGGGAVIYKVTEDGDGRKSSRIRDPEPTTGPEKHAVGSEAGSDSAVAGDGPEGGHSD